MREPDGLAMSSRNAYLAQNERRRAPEIYQTLKAAAESLRQGKKSIEDIEQEALGRLEKASFRPEYVSIRRTEDLGKPIAGDTRLSILIAAWLGPARLIDNLKVRVTS